MRRRIVVDTEIVVRYSVTQSLEASPFVRCAKFRSMRGADPCLSQNRPRHAAVRDPLTQM
jgi:hypothetical protein